MLVPLAKTGSASMLSEVNPIHKYSITFSKVLLNWLGKKKFERCTFCGNGSLWNSHFVKLVWQDVNVNSKDKEGHDLQHVLWVRSILPLQRDLQKDLH